ncbi:hypothetical protein BJ684DRAFT_20811 [Piptocephalis cylindrospora]|uniref:Uncharacterized protein n=1 Tax=Piptocephalis cylindrospora TaxID=1907219 RepID=A0A4P9Y1X3_9FUNG|nr:hypothetical protein BJ684DRAFT_20811 [Piptocephalis cylindrospora]|eukprot:RKP12664.1 hypothetical protein BJ684DRAFT_20811 [Piptocephalis cylindrospora]
MPTVTSYFVTALSLLSIVPSILYGLIAPFQIEYTHPFSLGTIHYGLYQACTSTTCRPFPDWTRDCNETAFCHGWLLARYLLLSAAILSLLLTMEALGALCGGSGRRHRAWKVLSPLLLLLGLVLAGIEFIIVHWKNQADIFRLGTTSYGYSMVLVYASSLISIASSLGLLVRGCSSPGVYQRLD